MNRLETIVGLSHEFGTTDYVRGGGGNTSAKDATTLWVKPSGTTLKGMRAESFVAMDRGKIDALYAVAPPADAAAREALVKELMGAAVLNEAGRPSVEAPLHNVFDATYVVHTHPALVNGMTCAVGGAEACARLFPDALWVEYIDPGYTLCMQVRERIGAYRREQGREPQMLMLKNHGVFIAADTAEEIRALYAQMMGRLREVYTAAGVAMSLTVGAAATSAATVAAMRACLGDDAAYVAGAGPFAYSPGPITPDHLVYAKAFPFVAELTPAHAAAYREARGYAPKVVVTAGGIFGIGTSQKNADLALEFALDGALVMQLATAFGGVAYMSDDAREFIENWEVESYRAKQV